MLFVIWLPMLARATPLKWLSQLSLILSRMRAPKSALMSLLTWRKCPMSLRLISYHSPWLTSSTIYARTPNGEYRAPPITWLETWLLTIRRLDTTNFSSSSWVSYHSQMHLSENSALKNSESLLRASQLNGQAMKPTNGFQSITKPRPTVTETEWSVWMPWPPSCPSLVRPILLS